MQTPRSGLADSLPLGQRQRLLLRLLRTAPGRHLKRAVARLHPADMAPLFGLLKPAEQANLLEVLFEMRLAGHTLSELDPEILRQVVEGFPDARLAVVLRRMPADDAADLLENLDEPRRRKLMDSLDQGLASRLNNLLLYGGSTAGGLMDPDVIHLQGDRTVAETLDLLRRLAERRRLFYLYVTDERGHLVGLVRLWQLVTSDADQSLRDIMSDEVVSVDVNMPQEEVAKVFARYDLTLMPVLDEEGLLVGVITVDDVIDVIEEEASRDLYRLGGLPEPETLGSPLLRSVWRRLPWLGLSLVGALLAALVVIGFETVIAKYAFLAALMHLVAATGGDSARQTLTVVAAAIATGEIEFWRPWRVVARQSFVGLLLGLASGAVLFFVALVLEGQWQLATVLLVAQIANQTVASTVACLLPLGLLQIGRDPTLGTSNLAVVAADVIGFGVFLGLASWLLTL